MLAIWSCGSGCVSGHREDSMRRWTLGKTNGTRKRGRRELAPLRQAWDFGYRKGLLDGYWRGMVIGGLIGAAIGAVIVWVV